MEFQHQSNPLKAYFRKPGIYIKLPSQGKFYDVKPADLNEMGEIPVYPLTAKDELLLKNADSLLNGNALTQLINSCAPSIVDPVNMPSIDLDAILVAIKRCTYGEKLDVTTQCECEAVNEVSVDLNQLIAGISVLEENPPIEHESGIKIFTKPITVKHLLSLNWVQYEQIRTLQLAEQQNMPEKEKMDLLTKSYETLTTESINVVSSSIDTVLLPDGSVVSDKKMIEEWVRDLSKPEYTKLETAIMDTNKKGVSKEFNVQCQKCSTVYKSSLDLNPTTFFA
jgi:hypothetical protein